MIPRLRRAPARARLAETALVLLLALAFALYRVGTAEPALGGLERALLDLRFALRGPLPTGPGVAIVAIDEAAVARYPDRADLRRALAAALERLGAAGPRAVGIDLLLIDATEADLALAAALSAFPGTVLAVAAAEASADPGPERAAALARSLFGVVVAPPGGAAGTMPDPPALLLPAPALAAAAHLAHANLVESRDRFARELPVALAVRPDGFLPALAIALAARAAPGGEASLVFTPGRALRIGGRFVGLQPGSRIILNHYGPAGTVPTLALLDLVEGRIGVDRLSGRVILIGATAPSLRDAFATPFGPDVPGVEVHATALLNILDGTSVRKDGVTAAVSILLALAVAGLGSLAMRLPGAPLPAAAGLLVLVLPLALAQAAFTAAAIWLDATAMTACAILGLAVPGFLRYRREKADTLRLVRERDNLSYYVAPSLAETLAQGARRSDFDGREQVVTVLFADLSGYSGLVERLPPAEVAVFLRALHAHVETVASRANAAVVGYMGDGSMIVFGLPDPAPGDAAAALACARALTSAPVVTGLAAIPPERVRFRVGLHTGRVAIVVVGGVRQGHVTVTGDTVNVAARLLEVAKAERVDLVASRETVVAAGATGLRPLGAQTLRGRVGRIELWVPDAMPS